MNRDNPWGDCYSRMDLATASALGAFAAILMFTLLDLIGALA